ncbi:hypothetical protein D9M69_671860 [compost metagenome]
MRHGAEDVETLAVPRVDHFTQQFGAPVGDVQAVAGIALGVEHVWLLSQATDLREAIGGDADHAAPLIVDAHIRQLREYLEHLWAHVGGDVRGVASGVMAGAAKQ